MHIDLKRVAIWSPDADERESEPGNGTGCTCAKGLETYPIFVYPVPLSMTSGAWRDIVLDAFSELIPRCRLELYAYSMLQ